MLLAGSESTILFVMRQAYSICMVPLNSGGQAASGAEGSGASQAALSAHTHRTTTAVGTPLRGNHILQRHFGPLCRALALPRVRLHDLRHLAASLWFDKGYATEVISKLLGHSSTTVTSTIYIHVTPYKQREAAALDRLFG